MMTEPSMTEWLKVLVQNREGVEKVRSRFPPSLINFHIFG